jgi:hypothetical protein
MIPPCRALGQNDCCPVRFTEYGQVETNPRFRSLASGEIRYFSNCVVQSYPG